MTKNLKNKICNVADASGVILQGAVSGRTFVPAINRVM